MKRAINTNCQPYISIIFYNKLEKVCLGCEAILTSQRDKSYGERIGLVIDYSSLCSKEEKQVGIEDKAIFQPTFKTVQNNRLNICVSELS